MEIKITIGNKDHKLGLLSKISYVLFGTFITSTIFAILIKLLDTTGIWIGLILSIILVFCGFYYAKKGSCLRLISWGILVTLIIVTLGFFIGLSLLSNTIEGF